MSELKVLYEDNHLLVVVKPPGVPTQGDSSGDPSLLDIARDYIKKRYNKPGDVYIGMVHRLDRPTGGVVALGRTSKAAARLSDQFRQRRVEKTYLAACHGLPKNPRAKLVHYLKKLPGVNRMVVLDKEKNGSQRAELSYRVMGPSADGKQALLEVHPLTGRQHQIRAQLARIDHPLVFDVKYSNRRGETAIVPAIGLWAYKLKLTHPTTNKPMIFTSRPEPLPGSAWEPFAALLRAGEQECEENPRRRTTESHPKAKGVSAKPHKGRASGDHRGGNASLSDGGVRSKTRVSGQTSGKRKDFGRGPEASGSPPKRRKKPHRGKESS